MPSSGIRNRVLDSLKKGLGISGAEEGSPGNKGIGSMMTAFGGIIEVDAAVDFEAESKSAFLPQSVEIMDGIEAFAEEGLPAKTRPDRHDEDEVDFLEKRSGFPGGRGRIENKAGPATEVPDALKGFPDRVVRFDVNGDEIGSRLGKGLHVLVWVVEHEVGVEEQVAVTFPQGSDGLRAEAQVRHKMSVHDVEVQPLDGQGFHLAQAVGKAGMVGGKN